VQRVLDVDLDFFVHGVASFRDPEVGRLDGDEYPPWTTDAAMSFLRERCGLDGPLPGFAVERHGGVFGKWQALIEAGQLQTPFHVTHVDAHGDLSMGEIGYKHVLTELVHLPLRNRPAAAAARVGDGDYLAYAIGCRWLRDLDYVYNEGGGGDVHPYFWEGFDHTSLAIRLAALTEDDVKALLDRRTPAVAYCEPSVPVRQIRWDSYLSLATFDLMFLARSSAFTPAEADALYEAIRLRFIDESALSAFA
jgi:hypothetical protein